MSTVCLRSEESRLSLHLLFFSKSGRPGAVGGSQGSQRKGLLIVEPNLGKLCQESKRDTLGSGHVL